MSTLASEALGISVRGDITSSSTTLMPTVTRVEPRIDVNPVSVILAISIVFILAPITISSNAMILAAFYRYKRLRTASNCLLASLAVSDFGVGVFMPFGMHLELSGLPNNVEVSSVCIVPYCIVIALCSVSVLVTVAIAVDRLTSLAQPLRYKNIITHSSVEKYIAVFWLYSIAVGLSPLIYGHTMGFAQSSHSGNCRFNAAVRPPVQVFLVLAVWAPSALVLLGCYMYVYLVARAHARAIYTVELSFRHQTQTMALPRYGQTLALTVGAFLVLWLPFQACMLLDVFCGTKILSEWVVVWLGLPILGHSAANPWIYAFHHGEMRVAAAKIAEDVVTRFGIHPSRYGCSPVRRGSNTNFELAEVNKSNEIRPPPVEDCFAAKHLTTFYQREKTKCSPGELFSSDTDISPEGIDPTRRFSIGSLTADIVEEDIHDLTNMLKPEYAIDRNHLIDSNHNIDKIRHLKHLLDPTFNKIRQLKCLNSKRTGAKTLDHRLDEPKFISYQNLKSDEDANRIIRQLNTMSDPTLHADNSHSIDCSQVLTEGLCDDALLCRRRNSNLSSMSDPNLKTAQANTPAIGSTKIGSPRDRNRDKNHGYSVHSLEHENSTGKSTLQCRRIDTLRKTCDSPNSVSALRTFELEAPPNATLFKIAEQQNSHRKYSNRHITLTTNKLANLNSDDRKARRAIKHSALSKNGNARLRQEFLKHSESISAIEKSFHAKLPEPGGFMDNLAVPTIHSEPSSPVQPLPLDSVSEGEPLAIFSHTEKYVSSSPTTRDPWASISVTNRSQHRETFVPSPSRLSNPMPHVLLNVGEKQVESRSGACHSPSRIEDASRARSGGLVPEELAAAILLSAEKGRERRPSGTVFSEHDSTRFSSRRPSDLRWSESSRSQEVLSTVNDRQKSPSSYSVNNVKSCTSGSDFNDVTCLGSFACPDALTSSLRESLFEPQSVPNSEVYTSLEDLENPEGFSPVIEHGKTSASSVMPMVHYSVSTVNLERPKNYLNYCDDNTQSKSSESVLKNHHRAILRLEASVHRSRPRVRPGKDCIIQDSPFKRNSRLAPLALPTPMEICTPTYDAATEIKGTSGVGVRV
ncbi:uncharacterized protein [Venturia canescens]|uniref:uncharacterized protein n=1 Tax=Venturia canescens TaxID=32260 RepID=UPI001C9CFDFE|nr:uncharacterized protein LOC122410193 [Venturia canescens]